MLFVGLLSLQVKLCTIFPSILTVEGLRSFKTLNIVVTFVLRRVILNSAVFSKGASYSNALWARRAIVGG